MSRVEVKNKDSLHQEIVTIIDQSTVIYSKRSGARNKNVSESNPNAIIVEGVDMVIVEQ